MGREPRLDAMYDVKIETPKGVLVSLTGADYHEAHSACQILMETSKDEVLLEKLGDCMESFGFIGSSGRGVSVSISARMPRVETGEVQTCGRRMNDFGPWERTPGIDTWTLIGSDRVCSFCGSLHPDRVIELIKEHGLGIIDPSTKRYKLYIHRPDVPNASFGGIKYYRWHDTVEFVAAFNDLVATSQA